MSGLVSRTLAALLLAVPLGWYFALDERKMIEAADTFTHEELSGYLHGVAVGQGNIVVGMIIMFATVGVVWGGVEGLARLLRYATRRESSASSIPPAG